jgi:hypothetical protein
MTVIPMGGESASIEQATEDTPFAVIRPTETPGGTQLVDVRVSQSPDGKDRDVLLFYGTSRPSEDASIEDWMLAGGIVIIETTHRWSESYVDQLYDRYGSDDYPTSYVKSIADLDVILMDAGWKVEAVMYRENLMYDVVVSPRFTMGELEMIAASIAEQIQAPSR